MICCVIVGCVCGPGGATELLKKNQMIESLRVTMWKVQRWTKKKMVVSRCLLMCEEEARCAKSWVTIRDDLRYGLEVLVVLGQFSV
jgi:hypothetical protein